MMPEIPLPPGTMQKAPPARVFWIVWLVITTLVPVYQFTLGHGLPHGTNAPGGGLNVIVILAVGEILAATALRWFVLPRAKLLQQVFVVMIIGLALSEAVEFHGLFLFPADQPETKLSLFILSLLSCAQFVPFYARPRPAADALR